MEIAVVISVSLMLGTMAFVLTRDMYNRFVKPFLCYKFVVFDLDDEYTKYVKKKDAIVREGIKGFTFFTRKGEPGSGEFYTLPLDKAYGDVNDKYSKRDDRGYITYYYYRNNNTPINIVPDQEISMVVNDARASNKILRTNIFDSSINMEAPDKNKIPWLVILIVIGAVFLLIMFQDKIRGLIGGAAG